MDNNFLEKLERFKLPMVLGVLGIVLIIGGIFTSGLNKAKPQGFPKESLVGAIMISVDVSGAVNKPGVYSVKDGSRIEEAIAQAGGFSESANREYISKYLNMAQKLSDGSKVYIPAEGDLALPNSYVGQSGVVAGTQTQSKVNINTATQAELEVLSGIGPGFASKIISGRPYQQVGDLLNKKVLGKAVFEKIKDSLVVY